MIETLVVLLIIQMICVFVVCAVESAANTNKLSLTVERTKALLRYARQMAMSTGQNCTVEFNATAQTVNLYLGSATTPLANPLFPGGTCSIKLGTDGGVSGAKISSVSNGGTAPYRVTYGSLGTRTNSPDFTQPMTVTFAYGTNTEVLTIPNVGDPQ